MPTTTEIVLGALVIIGLAVLFLLWLRRWRMASTVGAAATPAAAPASTGASSTTIDDSTYTMVSAKDEKAFLQAGKYMAANDCLYSISFGGAPLYRLFLQPDGDLVLQLITANEATHTITVVKNVWSTGTAGRGVAPYRAGLTLTGELYVADARNTKLWGSNSTGPATSVVGIDARSAQVVIVIMDPNAPPSPVDPPPVWHS